MEKLKRSVPPTKATQTTAHASAFLHFSRSIYGSQVPNVKAVGIETRYMEVGDEQIKSC